MRAGGATAATRDTREQLLNGKYDHITIYNDSKIIAPNALYRDITYKTPPEQNAPLISKQAIRMLTEIVAQRFLPAAASVE